MSKFQNPIPGTDECLALQEVKNGQYCFDCRQRSPFVEFFGELLEKKGYRVFKAFNGLEALAQVKRTAMDLFFVDIYMPQLDGREVIRQARETFSSDEMKIIAISGTARQMVEGLDELDFDAFLQKSPLEKMSKDLDLLMDSLEEG